MAAITTLTMSPAIDIAAATAEVVPVRKNRCHDVRYYPGGGGINVARVITRFGGDCQAIYPAGGASGQRLRRLLDGEGVASAVVDIAAETREDFTVTEEASGRQYRFIMPGTPLRAEEWEACLDCISALPDPPRYLVASGSQPPGVPDDFLARLRRVAARIGARFVVDTSGLALGAALDAGVHVVKPNLRELRELTGLPLGGEEDWASAAAALVSSGKAGIVTLTLGDQGALLVTADRRIRAKAPVVRVASAVGAGDSFLGAFVWQLSRSATIEDAFRLAVAAGTAALLNPGTELCQTEDAERLAREVVLQELPPAANA